MNGWTVLALTAAFEWLTPSDRIEQVERLNDRIALHNAVTGEAVAAIDPAAVPFAGASATLMTIKGRIAEMVAAGVWLNADLADPESASFQPIVFYWPVMDESGLLYRADAPSTWFNATPLAGLTMHDQGWGYLPAILDALDMIGGCVGTPRAGSDEVQVASVASVAGQVFEIDAVSESWERSYQNDGNFEEAVWGWTNETTLTVGDYSDGEAGGVIVDTETGTDRAVGAGWPIAYGTPTSDTLSWMLYYRADEWFNGFRETEQRYGWLQVETFADYPGTPNDENGSHGYSYNWEYGTGTWQYNGEVEIAEPTIEVGGFRFVDMDLVVMVRAFEGTWSETLNTAWGYEGNPTIWVDDAEDISLYRTPAPWSGYWHPHLDSWWDEAFPDAPGQPTISGGLQPVNLFLVAGDPLDFTALSYGFETLEMDQDDVDAGDWTGPMCFSQYCEWDRIAVASVPTPGPYTQEFDVTFENGTASAPVVTFSETRLVDTDFSLDETYVEASGEETHDVVYEHEGFWKQERFSAIRAGTASVPTTRSAVEAEHAGIIVAWRFEDRSPAP